MGACPLRMADGGQRSALNWIESGEASLGWRMADGGPSHCELQMADGGWRNED